MPERFQGGKLRAAIVGIAALLAAIATRAEAECAPEPRGDGRVQAVIDSRTLKLEDGGVIRLAGLAALRGGAEVAAHATLESLAVGRLVSLHGESGEHDRYGRLRAWVFAEGASVSLQQSLTERGHGVRDLGIADEACRSALITAESAAHAAKLGLWAAAKAVKNAETGDDISAEIGHFTVVGGRVRSVSEAGGWTYLNFGRRWREGVAGVVPKGAAAAFEAAGLPLKGLEGQRVRVRGFVQKRGGWRIDITSPDQIEAVGGKAVATAGTRD